MDGFVEPLGRDAVPPERHAGLAQMTGHCRPVQTPLGRQLLHAGAGEVFRGKLTSLVAGQPPLRLSPLSGLGRDSFPGRQQGW